MKIILAAVLLLVAAATIGVGFMSAPASARVAHAVPVVVMRAVPTPGAAVAAVAPTAAVPEAEAKPKPAVAEAPKPVIADAPKPVVADVPKPPVANDEPKPAVADVPKPAVGNDEPKPAPVVAAKPPAAPKPPAPEGMFNLRASDTADVYIDGRKVGSSPVLGYKVKAGKHKIRFDCYDESGDARPGAVVTHEVTADGEKDVEFECE